MRIRDALTRVTRNGIATQGRGRAGGVSLLSHGRQNTLGWLGNKALKSPENIQAARHHEEALIRAFVQSQRRERLLLFLGGTKGRDEFRRMLAHFRYLDERFARPIPANEHSPSAIAQRLLTQGAPERCYVISEIEELDGQWMPLHEALAQSVGRGMGTFISCVPGRLAYFEAEDPCERYVMQRSPPE